MQLRYVWTGKLILIKAPSLYPYWYPQWEEQMEAYAAERKLPYINFLELQEETGIDYTKLMGTYEIDYLLIVMTVTTLCETYGLTV